MNSIENTYITIPLYNDAKMILKVIKSLKEKGYNNIVVVDDGSKDNGYEVVKNNTVTIVSELRRSTSFFDLQTFSLSTNLQHIKC